jgi:PAB-dependent poly(A)-specific ribonuclease subunit 2
MLSLSRCSRYYILSAVDISLTASQEETELFTDGSRRVIRPARLGLARVSVIRGSGAKEGVPFIDDYIHTSEEIVNYLTEFSGIQRKLMLG